MRKLKRAFKLWVKRNLVDTDPEQKEMIIKSSPKQTLATEWLSEELRKLSSNGETIKLTFSKLKELQNEAKKMEKDYILTAACYDPFLGDLPKKEGQFYVNKNFK